MIEQKLQSEIEIAVQSCFPTSKFKSSEIEVTRPNDPTHGDFATNISFKLARELKKAPNEIAEKLSSAFPEAVFEKVEAINGFLNFYLKKEHYHEILREILEKKEKYANLDLFAGKKVQVEYLSANPTGPIHIGNARGIVGETIANVFRKAGANVETEFYINDVGGQANKFAATLLYWYRTSLGEKLDFPDGGYPGEFYKSLSQNTAKKIGIEKLEKSNDADKLEMFRKIGIQESMKLIKQTIIKLDVDFDKFVNQEDINKNISPKIFDLLAQKNQVTEKDGAKWFADADVDDSEYVLKRSDENSTLTYFMDDIAYHWDKFYNRKFDLVVDVWGSNHYGHILRMKKAMKAIGIDPERLQIALYQYVRLKRGEKIEKMAKRMGTYVTADQVLAEVPSDVFKFFLLMRSTNSHLDFDFELAKDTSEKNPVFYVKYAYARIHGILTKSKDVIKNQKAGLGILVAPEEIELIDQLSQLPQLVASIVSFDEYPVHYLTYYAIDTAKKFHQFYDKCRVIDEENLELTAARLELVRATKIVLGIVMRDLIGIDAPERM
jgi:arginyl-tRNA synthetase